MSSQGFTKVLKERFDKDYIPGVLDEYAMLPEGGYDDEEYKEMVYEYLVREEENSIRFGYALKRLIYRKYCKYSEEEKKDICVVDGIRFELDDYDDDNCSNEGYVNIINYLKNKNGVKSGAETKAINSWLNAKHQSIKRDIVFRLAFILKMNAKETEMFLTKVIFEQGYNFRDEKEIIYWYCHSKGLDLNTANILLSKYENLRVNTCVVKKEKNNNTDESTEESAEEIIEEFTEEIKEEVKRIKNEEDLMKYLNENKHKLTRFRASIRSEYNNLMENIKDLLILNNKIENMLKKENMFFEKENKITEIEDLSERYLDTKMFEWQYVWSSPTKKERVNISKKSELSAVLSDLPIHSVRSDINIDIGKTIKRKNLLYLRFYRSSLIFSICNNIYVLCNLQIPSVFKYIKEKMGENFNKIGEIFMELVSNEFSPIIAAAGDKEKKFLSMLNEIFKISKDNKDLICANFNAYVLDYLSEKAEDEEEQEKYTKVLREILKKRQEVFESEVNDKFDNLGIGTFYLGNKFDWLILVSMANLQPNEFFAAILSMSFKK